MTLSTPNVRAHLQERLGINARVLVWIEARNRATGVREPIGLWEGTEDITLEIDGSDRTYLGSPSIMSVEPIKSRSDLSVQMQRIVFSALSADIDEVMRERDARLAPIEIHVLHRDPQTREPIGVERRFRGVVDKAPIDYTPPTDEGEPGQAVMTVSAASATRNLTRGLTLLRSDESQSKRAGDKFFRFAAVGRVRAWWNQKRPRDG